MAGAFRDSREDGDVGVVILTGAGDRASSIGGGHVLHVICGLPIADLMAETLARADRTLKVCYNTGEAHEGARAGLLAVSQAGVVVASDIIGGEQVGRQ